jgi:predicted ester cyclase
MSAQQNKASVRRLVEEFWNKCNVAVADEIAAPNFVMHILPPGTPPGAESLKRFAAMVRTAFPDIHFSIEDEVAEGDRVAVRLIATGTHLGPYVNGLTTPTGKRFSMQGMDIWRFDGEGKWAECWSTYDTLSQLQQLGALPAAEPNPS